MASTLLHFTPPSSSKQPPLQRSPHPHPHPHPSLFAHSSFLLLDLCSQPKEVYQSLTPIIKHGLSSEPYTQNKLVAVFSRSGSIDEASLVFRSIADKPEEIYHCLLRGHAHHSPLDVTLSFYSHMRLAGIRPLVFSLTYILKSCADHCDLRRGREVHTQLISNGHGSNVQAMTAVVNMYAKCRRVDDARKMFDRMPERDLVTWNAVVAGYAQNGFALDALEMVVRMQDGGHRPDSITLVSVLPACADGGLLPIGKSVHGFAIRAGFEPLVNVSTAIVGMFAKCGAIRLAKLVFDRMPIKNVISWNSMIVGCSSCGEPWEALKLYKQLLAEEINPTDVTMMGALQACAELGDLEEGREVHKLLLGFGLGSDTSVMNALITMYSKCKRPDLAGEVFRSLHSKSLVSLVGVIPALADISLPRQAKWIHGYAVRSLLDGDVFVATALVDLYSKCGNVRSARLLFDRIEEKHVETWNAMIDGYGSHGLGLKAVELFEEMKRGTVKPSDVTFLNVLSACSHAGLVGAGKRYFRSMKEDHGLDPGTDHYGAMVDLLGRAGRLEEAWNFVEQMPTKPAIGVYGAMLGACKIHKDVQLGEKAAKKIFELQPEEGGYHVLLSNIYASASLWEDMAKVRSMMERQGLQKTPGFSFMESKNQVHTFYSGMTSHPQAKQIYAKVEELIAEIKSLGYVPDQDSAREAEKLLNGHSEKLAISFGLISTSPGTTIQIRKNLRVCRDCHNFTKMVTMVTGREIIVRDMQRFHHFKEGKCSCGDYW